MTNLYYISILRIRNCFKMFSCFIEAIYIHACWVGEAEGVGGAVGVGREGGVVGGFGVGGGEAVEDGIVPTGGVVVPAQAGEVAPAVADMGAVCHALGPEQLYGH